MEYPQIAQVNRSGNLLFCSVGRPSRRFTGKPVSQTTGLYYYYQRWYDPSIGRFVSLDPAPGHLSNPQSLNPYLYVDNTPTSATDPTGRDGGFGADHRCEQNPESCTGPDLVATWLINHVVQPATNFVNTNVIQPLVKSVVVPLVNTLVVPLVTKVVVPLALDYQKANNDVSQGLHDVGNQMWNGCARWCAKPLFPKAHISNMNNFIAGMTSCGVFAGIAATLYFEPTAAPLEIDAYEVATGAASITSIAMFAHGGAEALTVLGVSCVALTASSISLQ